MTRYRLTPKVPDDIARSFAPYSPLLTQLFYNRGVTTKEAADVFLSPNYDTGRHDPFLMTDMDRAVERILRAVRDNERIAIWSDYDCDGIPGGVLLHDFFRAINFQNFENYIPHRNDEGYGMNIGGLEELISRGAKIIITVDCGIVDHESIQWATEKGVDVIVTDHHELGATLPPAFAVLNPKRDDSYPFQGLCGSGVAWKLVEGLLLRGNFDLPKGTEKWLLDVVGLATLADMVPLVGENRVLAHYGMTVLRKTRRPGLQELFRTLRMNPKDLSEDDVGFMIAPRINAASRMGVPMDAFRMLTAEAGDAPQLAKHLDHINNERKGVVAAMVKDIRKKLALRTELESVIVVGDTEWRPSLVGLAANTLVEEHKRPVFVWGRDGREVIKGSCRSDGSVSVVSLMHEVKDALIEYGGHHASGGFSVRHEHIHTFGSRLTTAYEKVRTLEVPEEEVLIDYDLTLGDVTDSLMRDLSRLSPFGEGNQKPLFRFHAVVPREVSTFGKGKEHTKLLFEREWGTLEAISFFKTPDSFSVPLKAGEPLSLIAHIEKSFFGGRSQLRLRIVDVI